MVKILGSKKLKDIFDEQLNLLVKSQLKSSNLVVFLLMVRGIAKPIKFWSYEHEKVEIRLSLWTIP